MQGRVFGADPLACMHEQILHSPDDQRYRDTDKRPQGAKRSTVRTTALKYGVRAGVQTHINGGSFFFIPKYHRHLHWLGLLLLGMLLLTLQPPKAKLLPLVLGYSSNHFERTVPCENC